MSKTPFMPLWVSDFLGDTLDLDAAEIGAYMLLLMAQWNRAGRSLPDDFDKIRLIMRTGRNSKQVWGNIERFFDRDEDGIYSQRLRKEALTVEDKRLVNASSGALGGKAAARKMRSRAPEPAIPVESEPEPHSDVAEATRAYNAAAKASGWPEVQKLTKPRAAALRARLAEVAGIEGWRFALERAGRSDFLCRQFNGFSFDWLTKAGNFNKLMEGNYDNRPNNAGPNGGPSAKSGDRILEQIARAAKARPAPGDGRTGT